MPKQLPDTPWHMGYTKMKESDQRRLNKWCVHYDASICRSPKSGCYMLRCGGSSHCKFYAEDEKASRKIECDNRTQMEIDAEHRLQYVETLKPKMQALLSSMDDRRYMSVQSLRTCYVCGSTLLELEKGRKQCVLCHLEYVDQIVWLSDNKLKDGRSVYVMGRQKPTKVQGAHNPEQCRFCNGIGRCRNSDSTLFRKRCNPEYCRKQKKRIVRIEQVDEIEFTGVKNIPIDKIIVRNMSPPGKSKLDRAVEVIQREGSFAKPIYVERCKDKYLLKDGYIRYLAARQCGLSTVPATMEWKYVNCAKKK